MCFSHCKSRKSPTTCHNRTKIDRDCRPVMFFTGRCEHCFKPCWQKQPVACVHSLQCGKRKCKNVTGTVKRRPWVFWSFDKNPCRSQIFECESSRILIKLGLERTWDKNPAAHWSSLGTGGPRKQGCFRTRTCAT